MTGEAQTPAVDMTGEACAFGLVWTSETARLHQMANVVGSEFVHDGSYRKAQIILRDLTNSRPWSCLLARVVGGGTSSVEQSLCPSVESFSFYFSFGRRSSIQVILPWFRLVRSDNNRWSAMISDLAWDFLLVILNEADVYTLNAHTWGNAMIDRNKFSTLLLSRYLEGVLICTS